MRSPHHHNYSGQSGVTLVELLIVIVIIAIVATFALMQRGGANEQFQRQNIAGELKVALERARFDSVKRRADSAGTSATVAVNGGSFDLTTYTDQSGTLTAHADTTSFGGLNIVIANSVGTTLSAPITIYFNQRGEPVDSAGVSVSPVFLVCNRACTSPPKRDNANIIVVTPTGTVDVLPGGVAIPTFSPPNVSVVPTDTGIRSETVVLP